MIAKVEKNRCCGCNACASVCPNNCIKMQSDSEGFLYPEVDEARCIHCGLCNKVCIACDKRIECSEFVIFGVKNKNLQIRHESSSGGAFSALAEKVLEKNGVVFGATINESNKVCHTYVEDKKDIYRFRKSKYVQSDIGNMLVLAKKFLDEGRIVLFSGTPCQISALHLFLNRKYANLITVDMICVGVFSPAVFNRYISDKEDEYNAKVEKVTFRDKEVREGVLRPIQRNLTLKVQFEDGGEIYQYTGANRIFEGFLQRLYLRPSCHECLAKSFTSGSDIQLGDFWEIEKMYPEFCDKTKDGDIIPYGVSEVFIKTEKGKRLFNEIKGAIDYFEAAIDIVKEGQKFGNWKLLYESLPPHRNRAAFFDDFRNKNDRIEDLIKNHLILGDFEFSKDDSKKIGIIGSYNTREIVRQLIMNSNLELSYQFRNSNITSLMAAPISISPEITLPSNEFRAKMLEYDFKKEFIQNFEFYKKNTDYLLIDLLEERFLPVAIGDSYVTMSDAYMDCMGVQRGLKEQYDIEQWKNDCKAFTKILMDNFDPEKIILLELYLQENKGDLCDKEIFANCQDIIKQNEVLITKYKFFKKYISGVKTVQLDEISLKYSDRDHWFGCLPEHLNYWAYRYLAKKVFDLLITRC